MAKATTGHVHVPQARWVTVHAPKNAALAALLRGAGGLYEKRLSELSAAADPSSGASTTVNIPAEDAAAVAVELGRLLLRARNAGDPAADSVGALISQLAR